MLFLLFVVMGPVWADVPAGDWELVWADEFNGSSINSSNWSWGQLPWGGQHHNDEYSSYITSADSYLEDGSLILRCRKASGDEFGGYPYSEGMVYSKRWLQYGYLEIRARYPKGNGVWPAFWTLANGWPPEFDIAEYFGSGDRMHMGYCYGPDWTDTIWSSTNLYGEGFDGWHTYGLEWGPNYAKWFMDGVQRKTFTGSDVTSSSNYVILNSGMRWDADSSTTFPNYYEIDYFRWYQEREIPSVVDDDNGNISYSGYWGAYSGNSGYDNSEHYSESIGASATFTFTGTRARYYGFKRSDLGFAEILVDGESVDLVDCYSSKSQYFVLLYETPALVSGTHTLTVRVDGTKNSSSSGTEVIVDAFGVLTTAGSADTEAPEPNPMTWAYSPRAAGSTAIFMKATTATDASGVQYYFTCTSGDGHDSGWQTSPIYIDTDLSPATSYSYTVMARDMSDQHNQTSASRPSSATTEQSTVTLTLSATRGGHIVEPAGTPLQYNEGTEVIIEAVVHDPDVFEFVGWSGSAVESGMVVDVNALRTTVTLDADATLQANFLSRLEVILVDDNAWGDPGPNDLTVSDANENGTEAAPFDSIQEAIEVAAEHATIRVCPGTYVETIDFLGKALDVNGLDPNSDIPQPWPIIDANYSGVVVTFNSNEDPNSGLTGFVLTRGLGETAGAVLCTGASPRLSHCLMVGNRVSEPNGGVILCQDSNSILDHCTISGNLAVEGGTPVRLVRFNGLLSNSIVWDNEPGAIVVEEGSTWVVTYCDTQEAWRGIGTLSSDPLLVAPGTWIEVAGEQPVWVGGDYHLQSQMGRWDPDLQEWIADAQTSPCLDMAHPGSSWSNEPDPNGLRANQGAYGGTSQASLSLSGS